MVVNGSAGGDGRLSEAGDSADKGYGGEGSDGIDGSGGSDGGTVPLLRVASESGPEM